MGETARRFGQENFLLTRDLREYLTLMLMLQGGTRDRLELVDEGPAVTSGGGDCAGLTLPIEERRERRKA